MAIKRLTIDGYGQVELNNFSAPRAGRIEAQCAPSATAFSSLKLENGMLLAVNKTKGEVVIPSDASLPIGLVYSAEHVYDERKVGLKDFYYGVDNGNFLPRIGYLAVGDLWTENCISYDTSEFSDNAACLSALKAYKTTPLYGGISTDGAVLVSASAPVVGPKLLVVNGDTTMPDGTVGVKFQVITA